MRPVRDSCPECRGDILRFPGSSPRTLPCPLCRTLIEVGEHGVRKADIWRRNPLGPPAAGPGGEDDKKAIVSQQAGAGRRLWVAASVLVSLLGIGIVAGFIVWRKPPQVPAVPMDGLERAASESRNSEARASGDDSASSDNANRADGDATPVASPPSAPEAIPAELRAAVRTVAPAVVTILAKPSDRKGLGAGFIIRSTRLLATNHRVIAGAPAAVAVQRRPDGTEGISRGIQGFVACDPQANLALLVLAEDWPAEPLRLAAARPAIGAAVFAAGSNEGILGVISLGIVTAYGTAAEIDAPNLAARLGVLRTDVPILAGMSGGPMCDQDGQVAGVTTFCHADAPSRGTPTDDGLRFAITAAELSRLIERRGDRVRPLSELPGIRQ